MNKLFIIISLVFLLGLNSCKTNRDIYYPDFVLVVDAGHGGRDQGAGGRRSQEKDINLKTAKAVCKYIKKNCNNVTVIQTRPDDEFMSLNDRADMANFYNADLFISIHANATTGWAEGTETFIHPSAINSRSEYFAKLIQDEYTCYGKRKNRGVKTANFAVLRETRMPSVLTELGFITNKEEEKFMLSRKGRKKLAKCILRAFIRYRERYPQ